MSEAKLMRTSMYAGGTSPVKMIQAGFYNEDCLVYDLEDSVSAGEKDAARFLVYNAVKYQRPKDKYILIRVNGIYSKELDEDLEAAMRAQPDAIRIPKVEYAEEVQRIDAKMTAIEEKAGLPIGGVKLWCNIESYLGVIHAQEIATASPRVEAMALGAEDFTASMSAQRTKPGWEIFYARNAILMACRAAGISAQDAVFSDINDAEGLQKDLEMTRTLGFDGKTCVHPRQIDTVNACFTPSAKEIRNAQRSRRWRRRRAITPACVCSTAVWSISRWSCAPARRLPRRRPPASKWEVASDDQKQFGPRAARKDRRLRRSSLSGRVCNARTAGDRRDQTRYGSPDSRRYQAAAGSEDGDPGLRPARRHDHLVPSFVP